MPFRVGFTGTQRGMSERQKSDLTKFLFRLFEPGTEFHFGDCVGADAEAAALAAKMGFVLHSHPPSISMKRAHYPAMVVYPAKPYLSRNQDIVNAAHVLVACPAQPKEVLRSGTWATVRFAGKQGVNVVVFPP